MHVYIEICFRRRKRRDGMTAGFTDYSDLLNLTRAWEEPRAECWLKIPRCCQSTVVFIPTIDIVEVLLDKMATLTVSRERAAGMVLRVRRLNREAVYSGPADAEEARELPRGNRYGSAGDRRKWYGRMENGGFCIYSRMARIYAHVFIASRLAGIGRRPRDACLTPCLDASDSGVSGKFEITCLSVGEYWWMTRTCAVSFWRSLLERAMIHL